MIGRRLQELRTELAAVARQSGRDPAEIKLIAVSKRFPVAAILAARAAGQTVFGENYLQEAAEKRDLLPDDVELHLIGHLQSNKAKAAATLFTMIHTIDRFKIGAALNRYLEKEQRHLDVLVQINVGRDPNKAGVLPENAEALLGRLATLPNLHVMGLMTMPPYNKDPELSRPCFRELRRLAETFQRLGLFAADAAPELSMGMSHDYRIAIEEGATMIRIGTAIFGERY
jgi:pyridoxal phosphate enzyme (YggS family)